MQKNKLIQMLKDKTEEIYQKYVDFYYNNCKIHINHIVPIIDFENNSVSSLEIQKPDVIFINGEKYCSECYFESELKKLENSIPLPKLIDEIDDYDISKLKLKIQFIRKNYLKLLENIRNNNKKLIVVFNHENISYNTQKFLKSLKNKGVKLIQNKLLKYNCNEIEILVNQLKNKI